MPKTLADGRTKLYALTTPPAAFATGGAPTTAELTAGIRLDNRILKSDYRLSATGSDTINEAELSAEGNAIVYGASNYEGNITVFRYLTETGAADATEDVAWDLLREKGTTIYLVEREGPKATDPWAAGDVVDVYEIVTDNPQKPSDRTGFIKRTVGLGIQNAVLSVAVA